MKEVYCGYCGKQAEFVDSKVIYHGKSYGMIYLCRCCPGYAYVGVHKGTDRPKGTLANAELREWRKAAHHAFDPLWQQGSFKHRRKAAYSWLAQMMGLPVAEAHIGLFDASKCQQVINICQSPTARPMAVITANKQ